MFSSCGCQCTFTHVVHENSTATIGTCPVCGLTPKYVETVRDEHVVEHLNRAQRRALQFARKHGKQRR